MQRWHSPTLQLITLTFIPKFVKRKVGIWKFSSTKLPVVSCQRVAIRRSLPQIGSQRSVKSLDSEIAPTDAVGNAYRMNQRRVRVLPRSESRRGEYAAKPHLPYRNKLKKYGELLHKVVQQFAMRIDVLRRPRL